MKRELEDQEVGLMSERMWSPDSSEIRYQIDVGMAMFINN
jgi:hypothetical protein